MTRTEILDIARADGEASAKMELGALDSVSVLYLVRDLIRHFPHKDVDERAHDLVWQAFGRRYTKDNLNGTRIVAAAARAWKEGYRAEWEDAACVDTTSA